MAMLRSFGSTSFTTFPSTRISPPEISSIPAIMLRSVDLPQPDGPTRMKNSPSAMVKSASFTATVPSAKRLVTLWSAISAIASALYRPGGEPGDDAALEDEHHDDDGNGDHHRGGSDRAR